MFNTSSTKGPQDWPDFNPLVEVVMGAVSDLEDKSVTVVRRDRRDAVTVVDGVVTGSEERFECQTCGRSYKHYFHLKAHRRECSIEPLFRCEECHKRFYHSRNLGRHMQNVHKLKKKMSDQPTSRTTITAVAATATTTST